jgi:nitrate reductase NapE component
MFTHSASLYLAAVLFPVIALGLSTIFENYQWSLRAVFGFAGMTQSGSGRG